MTLWMLVCNLWRYYVLYRLIRLEMGFRDQYYCCDRSCRSVISDSVDSLMWQLFWRCPVVLRNARVHLKTVQKTLCVLCCVVSRKRLMGLRVCYVKCSFDSVGPFVTCVCSEYCAVMVQWWCSDGAVMVQWWYSVCSSVSTPLNLVVNF